MLKPKFFAGLALLILILTLAQPALAQSPQPFSADMSATSTDGGLQMKGKFYFSAPNIRMDILEAGGRKASGPGGGKTSTIVNGAKKITYVLMPEQQMYMEISANDNNPMRQRMLQTDDYRPDPCSTRDFASCKKVGTETVNGRTCDKWEAVETGGEKHTFWVDQKLHFPIKSQNGKVTTEFTNIKEGAQDASLFVVPAGYRKFDVSMFGRAPQ